MYNKYDLKLAVLLFRTSSKNVEMLPKKLLSFKSKNTCIITYLLWLLYGSWQHLLINLEPDNVH